MADFITKRGTLYYILIWVTIFYAADYGQKWFFDTFNIQESGYRFTTFIVILIALFMFTFVTKKED